MALLKCLGICLIWKWKLHFKVPHHRKEIKIYDHINLNTGRELYCNKTINYLTYNTIKCVFCLYIFFTLCISNYQPWNIWDTQVCYRPRSCNYLIQLFFPLSFAIAIWKKLVKEMLPYVFFSSLLSFSFALMVIDYLASMRMNEEKNMLRIEMDVRIYSEWFS